MERFFQNKIFTFFIYALLGLTTLFLLMKIKPVLVSVFLFAKKVMMPFLFAIVISYVLNPVVNLLHQRKVPRTFAVLLIYAVFLTSVTVVLMNFIPVFMKQLRELNEHFPELSAKAEHWIREINDSTFLPEMVREGVQKALARFENMITTGIYEFINGIGDTLNMIIVAFIVPFLVFYMLKDFQLIEKTALAFVPKKHRYKTIRVLMDIDKALGNYIRGQFLVCVMVGATAYLGYWLIDLPYPLLLASVVGVFNIIPYLGPFFGAAPAILMAMTVSVKMVLMVIMVNVIVQILEGNVISPFIVGRTLHMHPMVIIFVLLVGEELAGILGLILAVPVFAVIKVIFHHVSLHWKTR